MFSLRPYQERGVTDIRAAFAAGRRAPLYTAPTGSGKTRLFCYMANSAHQKGNRVMVLVHRGELLRQTSKALAEQEIPHSFVAPGRDYIRDNLIHVATVQTLGRRIDRVLAPDFIIADECHHFLADNTFGRVFAAFPNAKILGVTATPARLDGRGLGGIFDHLVRGPEVQDLIDQGYLARPKYYAPPVGIDTAGVHTLGGDFNKAELEAIVDRPTVTGNAVEHYRKLASGVPAIAFCVSIKHMNSVVDEFTAGGFRALGIDGTMDDEQRADRISRLSDGRLDVLASVDLLGEGVDVPIVGCGIMLRPTQSLSVHLQQLGRPLRPGTNKEFAIILDHAGNLARHGFAEEPRQWSLDPKAKLQRSEQAQDPAFRIRTCPQCYAVSRWVPRCPQCGCVFPIESRTVRVGKGTLEEITAREQEKVRRNREVAQANTRPELERIAKERGYSPKWVGMQLHLKMRQRFRRKPKADNQPRLFAET